MTKKRRMETEERKTFGTEDSRSRSSPSDDANPDPNLTTNKSNNDKYEVHDVEVKQNGNDLGCKEDVKGRIEEKQIESIDSNNNEEMMTTTEASLHLEERKEEKAGYKVLHQIPVLDSKQTPAIDRSTQKTKMNIKNETLPVVDETIPIAKQIVEDQGGKKKHKNNITDILIDNTEDSDKHNNNNRNNKNTRNSKNKNMNYHESSISVLRRSVRERVTERITERHKSTFRSCLSPSSEIRDSVNPQTKQILQMGKPRWTFKILSTKRRAYGEYFSYIVYEIEVKEKKDKAWRIYHRYQSFYNLQSELHSRYPSLQTLNIRVPPKTILKGTRQVINSRCKNLALFLHKLAGIADVREDPSFVEFIGCSIDGIPLCLSALISEKNVLHKGNILIIKGQGLFSWKEALYASVVKINDELKLLLYEDEEDYLYNTVDILLAPFDVAHVNRNNETLEDDEITNKEDSEPYYLSLTAGDMANWLIEVKTYKEVLEWYEALQESQYITMPKGSQSSVESNHKRQKALISPDNRHTFQFGEEKSNANSLSSDIKDPPQQSTKKEESSTSTPHNESYAEEEFPKNIDIKTIRKSLREQNINNESFPSLLNNPSSTQNSIDVAPSKLNTTISSTVEDQESNVIIDEEGDEGQEKGIQIEGQEIHEEKNHITLRSKQNDEDKDKLNEKQQVALRHPVQVEKDGRSNMSVEPKEKEDKINLSLSEDIPLEKHQIENKEEKTILETVTRVNIESPKKQENHGYSIEPKILGLQDNDPQLSNTCDKSKKQINGPTNENIEVDDN